MAFEQQSYDISLVAGADLTAQQFRGIILNAGGAGIVAGAAAQPIGVLQNNPPNGGEAQVRKDGITKMVVGAGVAVAINNRIGLDGAGAARPAVAGDPIVGRALTAGGAAAIVSVLLNTDRLLTV